MSREADKVEFATVTVEESLEELRAEMVKALRYGTTFVIDLWKSCPDFTNTFNHSEIFDTSIIFDRKKFLERDQYMKFVKENEVYSPGGMNNVFYANDDFMIVILTSLKEPEKLE